MSFRKQALILATALALPIGARVQLPAVYSDHMVLQQQSEVHLQGKAAAGARLTMRGSWMRKPVTAEVDADGRFMLHFRTPKAGGPYTLSFSDGDTLILRDVLVGEVWLGSGQSNMEMPVAGWGKVRNYQEEIASADYPSIRLLQVPKKMSFSPVDPISADMGTWQECSPATVPEFSALGYFYARELWQKLHVPVGIINASWGGTPAEAWTSSESLSHVIGYEKEVADLATLGFLSDSIYARYRKQYDQWLVKVGACDKGLNAEQPWMDPALDDADWSTMDLPQLFDKEVLPSFDGVVWFRFHLAVPDAWVGQDILLNLAQIDDEDLTYWNGVLVAHGEGYNQPRHYVVPAALVHAGDNVITVRVQDTGGEGGIWGEGGMMSAGPSAESSVSIAGSWRYRIGCRLSELPTAPLSPSSAGFPSVLFNAKIAPLQDFPFAGVIWYQGCANVGRAEQYRSLFTMLICDWRSYFHRHDMPFYFVQLANYLAPSECQPTSAWAALRESQAAACALENVEMVSNIDLGEAGDIHPKNKQEVARRLALIALNRTYGKKVAYTAPIYRSYYVTGDTMHIQLDYSQAIEKKLVEEGALSGFIIAGPDYQWHKAEARLAGQEILVWCDGVSVPIAVRYGWADNPTCTLRTPSGLHVAPFRTDNF